jgi:hypothetical protein
MMHLLGMGANWWLRRIFAVAQCGSPRVEVQALKLAGLALGSFDDPAPSQGAKIIIEAAADSNNGKSGVRVTMEGDNVTQAEPGTFTFATANKNKRRKALRNLT